MKFVVGDWIMWSDGHPETCLTTDVSWSNLQIQQRRVWAMYRTDLSRLLIRRKK